MKNTLSACTLCLLCLTGWTVAGAQKKKGVDPTPRKDAILKLFAEEFVAITPGKGKFPESFTMGSEKGGDANERPAHKVTFKYSFAIAKYEVTQELYHVVTGTNPAQFQGLRNGIDKVNWQDAMTFCERATKLLRERKLIAENERIRLPPEAEWEYCCRAGTTTAWSFGDDVNELGKYSWFKGNSAKEDPPVGMRLPNPWGLYDMHGYVWEWCLDPWHPDYKDAPTDGSARKGEGKEYVLRGGAYPDPPDMQRSAFRFHMPASTKRGDIGFRCVKDKEKTIKVSINVGDTKAIEISSRKWPTKIENPNSKVAIVQRSSGNHPRINVDAISVGTVRITVIDGDGLTEVFEVTVVPHEKTKS